MASSCVALRIIYARGMELIVGKSSGEWWGSCCNIMFQASRFTQIWHTDGKSKSTKVMEPGTLRKRPKHKLQIHVIGLIFRANSHVLVSSGV